MNDSKSAPTLQTKQQILISSSISDQISTEDFYEYCKSQLKISKNNSYLQNKFKDPSLDMYDSGLSFVESKLNEERVLKLIAERKARREAELLTPRNNIITPYSQDSLYFLVLSPDTAKLMISSYELQHCKKNFLKILNNSPNCHEAYFGLGRLASYECKFVEALHYLNNAISIHNDELYIKWYVVVSIKCNRLIFVQESYLPIFCCFKASPINQEKMLQRLSKLPVTVETLWCYMELSGQGLESEAAEFYASKIKDIDKYYGYLAWSELYLQHDWQKGVSVLKELIKQFPYRPEAYTRLWKYYYYTAKNYEFAEDVISEAFLRVTDYTYNNFYLLFCLYCAKSYYKTGKIKHSLQLLQKKFLENYDFPIFLYQFGRLACKSEQSSYISAAVGALKEFNRLCPTTKQGCSNFWLAKAYLQLRHYTESYKYITRALLALDSTQIVKKENLRRWANDLKLHISALKEAELILKQPPTQQVLAESVEIMKKIKNFHKFSAGLLNAKIIWVSGNHKEAVNKIRALCDNNEISKSAYTLLFKYLSASKEFVLLEKCAFDMVSKCNLAVIPTELWITGNLWYAKALAKNGKPLKAILVLKSVAKIFTPLPYISTPFTRALQRACTVQQLNDPSSVNFHVYDSYRHSFTSARDLSNQIIDDNGAPIPDIGIFQSRRLEKSLTVGLETFKQFFMFINLGDDEDFKEIEVIPQKAEDGFIGISVYSKPKFLYLIGKYALKFGVMNNDGICALKDFIEVLQSRMENPKALAGITKAKTIIQFLIERST